MSPFMYGGPLDALMEACALAARLRDAVEAGSTVTLAAWAAFADAALRRVAAALAPASASRMVSPQNASPPRLWSLSRSRTISRAHRPAFSRC